MSLLQEDIQGGLLCIRLLSLITMRFYQIPLGLPKLNEARTLHKVTSLCNKDKSKR